MTSPPKALVRGVLDALRPALAPLESLPTLARGKAALGIDSLADCLLAADRYGQPGQRPYLFLPGVPARPFFNAADFEWTAPLQAALPDVQAELDAHLARGDGFRTYKNELEIDDPDWNALTLFFGGEAITERCPRTRALLSALPRFEPDHTMFSALNPGRRIAPHFGPLNGLLRVHLPLVIPPACGIRVGDQTRSWSEGEVMVLDDSFEHEAWNDSDQVRVLLFMSFWHPIFSDDEVAALRAFLRATYGLPQHRRMAAAMREERAHNLVHRL